MAAAAACRRAGRCGRCVLRGDRLLAGADAARVRGCARARVAGETPCRPVERSWWRRTGGGVRRTVGRPHRAHVRSRRACDGAVGNRCRAAAGRLPRAARNEAAAARAAARAGCADGDRDRLQSRYVAAAVLAAGDAAVVHAFPHDPGGSAARRDGECGTRAGPFRSRASRRRNARGHCGLEHPRTGGTRLLDRRCARTTRFRQRPGTWSRGRRPALAR